MKRASYALTFNQTFYSDKFLKLIYFQEKLFLPPMRIFSSLAISVVAATDCDSGDFCVTSCNDVNNNNATAMTISVDQDYMEQHHNALTLGSKNQRHRLCHII